MNVKELKEILKKQGGLTLTSRLEESEEKEGFYCSILGYEKILTYNVNEDIKKESFLTTLKNNLKAYKEQLQKNQYIGLWINEDKLYIDITKHYKDKKEDCDIKLLKDSYILYKYNRFKNDIQYIKEYYSINDVKDLFKDIKYIHQFINDSIDKLDLHILKNKYVIVKDSMYYKEYLEIIKG